LEARIKTDWAAVCEALDDAGLDEFADIIEAARRARSPALPASLKERGLEMVGRKPGALMTGGRKKGTPNKAAALLRDAILKAVDEAGGLEGLKGYLKEQALANPGPFMSLLGKVLPAQVPVPSKRPMEKLPILRHRILPRGS
jgi:hypothetical protein